MMRIALAAYRCENKEISYNLRQIEKGMKEASGKADLICFSEAFLQGFDCLDWNHENDLRTAVCQDSVVMNRLRHKAMEYGISVGFGYIEKGREDIYSSFIILNEGETVHNYRRISRGWKEYTKTDEHYREGDDTGDFFFMDHRMRIALCGDLWDHPERFETGGILLWPIYVCFSLDEWKDELAGYGVQAGTACDRVLMVNCIDPDCHGGAFFFEKGEVKQALAFDEESILYCEV